MASRSLTRWLVPVHKPQAGEGLIREQKMAVEVEPVGERRDRRCRRHAELRLDHAAEHHAQAEGPCSMDHANGLSNSPRLGELDVDALGVAGDPRDVAQVVAAFVDDHGWPRRKLAQGPERVEVGRGKGLLHELHSELHQRRHQLAGGLERPALVGIHAQRGRGDGPHGLEPRQVLGPSELELECAVRTGPPHPVARPLDAVDADRVGRGPRFRKEPQEAPHRDAEPLADPVVQRRVDGRLGRGLTVHVLEPRANLLERERVVADQGRRRLREERGRRGDRLPAVVDGRRLAAADDALVLELDLHHGLGGARAARDTEGLGEGEVH
jgi:hypothetical protein